MYSRAPSLKVFETCENKNDNQKEPCFLLVLFLAFSSSGVYYPIAKAKFNDSDALNFPKIPLEIQMVEIARRDYAKGLLFHTAFLLSLSVEIS